MVNKKGKQMFAFFIIIRINPTMYQDLNSGIYLEMIQSVEFIKTKNDG